MALLKSKRSDIPADAVLLNENEALKYQMDLVKKWHKTSDVFALRYGPYILGGAALLNGAYFNNHFRRKFMLGAYGRLATYIPICFVPGSMAILLHTELVLRQVVLMKSDQCPVCLESRAAAIQSVFSTLFPLVIAPIGCATVAVRYGTYDVPSLHETPRKAISLFKKMFSRIQTKTFYLFLGQALLGSVITYFEASNLIKISQELARYDEKVFECE